MKTVLKTAILFIVVSCKVQCPTYDLQDPNSEFIQGAYYSDTHYYLDQFVGTWLYSNPSTNTIFEIRLFKRLQNQSHNHTFEDVLYGEYRYVENGIEKINTLSNLNNYYTDAINYGVYGNSLRDKMDSPICTECTTNQKRVFLMLSDNIKHVEHNIQARVDIVGGQTIMRTLIYSDGLSLYGVPSTGNPIRDLSRPGIDVGVTIPVGYYDFIKQ